MSFRLSVCIIDMVITFAYMGLNIFVFSIHEDVLNEDCDRVKYKDKYNRVANFEIFVPFVFVLLSIAMGDIFGVLIIGYVVALSIFRIKQKQVKTTSNVLSQQIKNEQDFTVTRIINCLIYFLYLMVRLIVLIIKSRK